MDHQKTQKKIENAYKRLEEYESVAENLKVALVTEYLSEKRQLVLAALRKTRNHVLFLAHLMRKFLMEQGQPIPGHL